MKIIFQIVAHVAKFNYAGALLAIENPPFLVARGPLKMQKKPREPKPIDRAHAYTVDEIGGIVRELETHTDIFRRFAEMASKQPAKTMAAHNWKGLQRGLDGLRSAVSAVEKSMRFALMGTPILENEVKPRSPARGLPITKKLPAKTARKK